LLEHHDYDHVSFDNGEEALDFLSKHTDSVDLILSDIKMPRMDGIELAAKAAQIKPNIPIILISGYSDKLWEGMTAPNVKAVLDKPVFRIDLVQTIEAVLGNAKRRGKRVCSAEGDRSHEA
jgi:two-component system cell cycle response regulator CpdR